MNAVTTSYGVMSTNRWMIYGANGYTGRLIAREAVGRGERPVLAGRSRGKIEPLARELGCESRVFKLRRAQQTASHLEGLAAVLHCAGPFSATGVPMIEACLAARVHYLDITGELDVIEAAAERHGRARAAGVGLIPAVGFDVVPSDCLAAMLARRLPGATHLELAFFGQMRLSPGTAKTMLEKLAQGGRVRKDGKITRVPFAWKVREIPFRHGAQRAMTIPWGDVATAYHTTGIPNVEVYSAMPGIDPQKIRYAEKAARLLRFWPLRALARRAIRRRFRGPSDEERRLGRAEFWGRASDDAGRAVEATLDTPEGYRLTVATALAATLRVLAGGAPPGFSTPAAAFGEEFILEFDGTDFEWRE